VVADGSSSDGTVELLKEFANRSPWIRFVSEPDGGIYHAINKAIALASGQYYVVAGADDLFDEGALLRYDEYTMGDAADVVFARVVRAGRVIGGFQPHKAWVGPSRVFPSSHSVGTLFKRNLHQRFGPYPARFPLLADVYFLKILLLSGSVNFVDADFNAGTFTEGGATSGNQLQLLAENWQIQMLTEPHPILQTVLFFGKVVTRFPTMRRELRVRSARSVSASRANREARPDEEPARQGR
jgi:hypothetical protein